MELLLETDLPKKSGSIFPNPSLRAFSTTSFSCATWMRFSSGWGWDNGGSVALGGYR